MPDPHSPTGHSHSQSNYGNKKDVGVMYLSVLIPVFRLSHCLYVRISNAKPAHAERYIYIHYGHSIPTHLYTQRACTFVGCTPYYIYKRG